MRTVAVQGPEGARWSVRVVWEPRWRALARRFGGWRRNRGGRSGDVVEGTVQAGDAALSGGGGGGGGGLSLGDEILVIVLVFIAFVVAGALFWWVLLPLLLVVLDVLIVVILLVVSVAARVLLRRPWQVRAAGPGGELITAEVVGWRAALRRRDEMADALRHGLRPAEDTVTPWRGSS